MTKQEAISTVNRAFSATNCYYPSKFSDLEGWLNSFRRILLPRLENYEQCSVYRLPTDGWYYTDYGSSGLFEDVDGDGEIRYDGGTKITVLQKGSVSIDVRFEDGGMITVSMNNRGNNYYHCWIDVERNGRQTCRICNCMVGNGKVTEHQSDQYF